MLHFLPYQPEFCEVNIMSEKKIILETERLILRRYCKEDLYEYLSDGEVVKHEPYSLWILMK